MLSDLLLGLADETPVLLHKGRIFLLDDRTKGSIVWQNSLGSMAFTESDQIVHLEELAAKPVLCKLMAEAKKRYAEKVEALNNEASGSAMSDMDALLIKFLCGGKKGLEKELIRRVYPELKEDEIPEFPLSTVLHSGRDAHPVLSSIVEASLGVIIVRDKYLRLSSDQQDKGFGTICFTNNSIIRKVGIIYGGKAESLISDYVSKFNQAIKSKIEAEKNSAINKLKAVEKKRISISELGEIEGRGVHRKGDQTYVYMSIPSYEFRMYKDNQTTLYKLPGCRLGVNVAYNDGDYSFGRGVIIARQIDVNNPLCGYEDLYGKDYVHPATYKQDKSYTYFCIEGGGWKYDEQVTMSQRKARLDDLVTDIQKVLMRMAGSIADGYYVRDLMTGAIITEGGQRKTASVHRYFDGDLFHNNPEFVSQMEKFRVR